MTHISPAVYLTWAVLSITLGAFLIFHLWSFDRFRCLRWNHGPHSRAFRRLMTYSYLLSIPLLIVYSVGFTVIKYTYGFTSTTTVGITPTPYRLWSQSAQHAILPLYLCFSFAWALEMVTHLEELCFWLFLIRSHAIQQDWFQSSYFKIWAVGSCLAVIMMPLVTILTRQSVLKCEASTFLAGGLGSFSLTVWFLPVLWTFPAFLENLRQHDIDIHTLIRLTKFHELNCIRVVFRFLFTVSAIVLGADGIRSHQDINDKTLPTDVLGIFAGIGCVVSSGLTLIIFFPRSLEGEMALRGQQQARKKQRAEDSVRVVSTQTQDQGAVHAPHMVRSYISIKNCESDAHLGVVPDIDEDRDEPFQGKAHKKLPEYEVVAASEHGRYPSTKTLEGSSASRGAETSIRMAGRTVGLQPNRKRETGDIELGSVLSEVELLQTPSKRDRRRSVHTLVHHWRSPIEIGRPSTPTWQRCF